MAQVLALEWDGSEARLVVASSRAERVQIEEAFSVPLRPGQSDEDEAEVDVGGRIAAALAARGIGRIDTLVAVGRANIELRQLSLPAAPDDEMPEMVHFQAMREFNEFDEDWLLDFVPIDDGPEEGPRSVLAAAIGPELVEQIQGTCEKAGLTARRMILRPCAAASLLGRAHPAGPTPLRLLIDLLPDEADLTAMIDRKVVLMRTTRLSRDPLQNAANAQVLLAELRRTIAAVENQLGGRSVESIMLCGSDEPYAALAKLIEGELGTPTELFDPFAGLDLGHQLRRTLPDHPGRFTPLLGMALAELEGTGHAIDFLHPRRRAEPPSRRWKFVAAGAAAVLLVGSFFGFRGLQRKWLLDEIRQLTADRTELEKEVSQAKEALAAMQAIERWTATDVVWLDQLYRLSSDFPPAKEAMLRELKLAAPGPRGGTITLEGLGANVAAITEMEDNLRNKSRRVDETGNSPDESNRFYQRRFNVLVFVDPEEK